MDACQELDILIRAKYPIVYIASWEEARVEDALRKVCGPLSRTLHTWTITQGMNPPLSNIRASNTLPGELEALAQVHEAPEYTVFLLKDFHVYMKDSRVVRLLRDLALRLRGKAQTLVLLSPILNLPSELEKEVTVIDFPLPNAQDIESELDKVIASVKDN